MKKISTVVAVLSGTTLGACTGFGPSREAPPVPLPASYTAPQAGQPPAAGVQPPRVTSGARPVPQWWRAYGSDTLDQLVEEGLAASPSLAAAQSTLQAARESLRARIGESWLPQVDLTAVPLRGRTPALATVPQRTQNLFLAQVQASYAFDFFGQVWLANRAQAGEVRQQAWQLESTRRQLAMNIVVATITAASLAEQVDTVQHLVDSGEARARQLAGRYRAGSATHDEALAAEQDAAEAAAALPALRAQLAAVRHGQAVLLGRTPDRAPPPLALDSLHVPGSVPVSVPSDLLHQRPDILAAEAAVQSAADAEGAATAALFPSLTLSAAYGRGALDWSTFVSPAGAIWGAGAVLTQPLFHGGALRAQRRAQQARYDAAVALYRQTVLSAFRSVADDLASLEEDDNTIVQTRRAEAAAHEAEGSTTSRYRLGATSYYVTLTAEQQYLNAHLQLLRARAAQLADTAALFDAMGVAPAAEGDEARR
jgi:NodT family efflux transporter outer membrane factor (OMF) lipoprotein